MPRGQIRFYGRGGCINFKGDSLKTNYITNIFFSSYYNIEIKNKNYSEIKS